MERGSNSERKPLIRWVQRNYTLNVKDKDGREHLINKDRNVLQFWNGHKYEDVSLFSEQGICLNEHLLIGEISW